MGKGLSKKGKSYKIKKSRMLLYLIFEQKKGRPKVKRLTFWTSPSFWKKWNICGTKRPVALMVSLRVQIERLSTSSALYF